MTRVLIDEITPNTENPRSITEKNFKKLVQSIKDFPQMLEIRPIIVNQNMMILGGNMRLRACQEAGLKEIPVKIVTLTAEQEREFIIKDNLSFGQWDYEILSAEWDLISLKNWGLDMPEALKENEKIIDYTEKLEVVVECNDEREQQKIYDEMKERGFKCRVLSM